MAVYGSPKICRSKAPGSLVCHCDKTLSTYGGANGILVLVSDAVDVQF